MPSIMTSLETIRPLIALYNKSKFEPERPSKLVLKTFGLNYFVMS